MKVAAVLAASALLLCGHAQTFCSESDKAQLKAIGAKLDEFRGDVTKVSISGHSVGQEVIDQVAALGTVQTLYLTDCTLNDDALNRLSVLNDQQLVDFGFYDGVLTQSLLERISRLANLKALGLTGCNGTAVGLEPLAQLTGLRTLRLSASDVGNSDMAVVGRMKSLQMLMLDNTSINATGLGALQSLPSLNYISLRNTTVNDEACRVLATLSARALILDGTRVTDTGLGYLAEHKELSVISLNNTATSDSGVRHFEDRGVYPDLSENGIAGTRISLAAARRMEWLSNREVVKREVLSIHPELRRQVQPISVASKLHVLLAMDTNAANIGRGVGVDAQMLRKILDEIRDARPGKIDVTVVDGQSCTPDAIRNHYTFKCGNDESLLFFYSGHGGLDEQRGQFLAVSNGVRLYLSELRGIMEGTGARLCAILTNCCSNIAGFAPPNRRVPAEWETFKDIFFAQAGIVDITAASEGEFAWVDGVNGGMFTRAACQLMCEPVARLDVNGDGFVTWPEFYELVRYDTNTLFQDAKWRAPDGAEIKSFASQYPSSYCLGTSEGYTYFQQRASDKYELWNEVMSGIMNDFSEDTTGTAVDQVRRVLAKMGSATELLRQALDAVEVALDRAQREDVPTSTTESISALQDKIAGAVSQMDSIHNVIEARIEQNEQQALLTARLQRLTDQLHQLTRRIRPTR